MKNQLELHTLTIDLLPDENQKLERLIQAGKYRTKVDFFRHKIRLECEDNEKID